MLCGESVSRMSHSVCTSLMGGNLNYLAIETIMMIAMVLCHLAAITSPMVMVKIMMGFLKISHSGVSNSVDD